MYCMRRWTAATLVLLIGLSSSSCGSNGVSIPDGYQNLERCRPTGPVDVTQLANSPELEGCDPVGTIVVFPDGKRITSVAVGVGQGHEEMGSGEHYSVTNWGTPGITAAFVSNGSLNVWGTDKAIKLHVEAIYRAGNLNA